jgi:hypothetical protein
VTVDQIEFDLYGCALFADAVERLLKLRARGWVRFTDGRVARSQRGIYLMAGPCDLTDAGQQVLEVDRLLKPQ